MHHANVPPSCPSMWHGAGNNLPQPLPTATGASFSTTPHAPHRVATWSSKVREQSLRRMTCNAFTIDVLTAPGDGVAPSALLSLQDARLRTVAQVRASSAAEGIIVIGTTHLWFPNDKRCLVVEF